jgi:O-antigen ligase
MMIYLVVPPGVYVLQLSLIGQGLEPSPVFRAIKLFLMGASACIIMWRAALAWLTLKSTNFLLLVCLALIALSPLWSVEPGVSLNRAISLASTVFVCFAFVLMGWHPQRVQSVVRPIITGLLAGSIVFGILFPDLAIDSGEGTLKNAWRGLAYQKNQFGILASLGTIFWLHAWLTKERGPWTCAAGVLLAGTCLLLSRSSASLLATVLTAGLLFLLLFLPRSRRRYIPYLVTFFATTVVVYALAVLNIIPGLSSVLTDVANFFGKDSTFSNRSFIWSLIEEHIRLHPALGTGYGAYWVGPVPSSPSYVFVEIAGFYPSESHNGYLEVVNDLGFVGLAACIGFFMVFVRQSLKLMSVERNQGILYLCIFFQNAVGNLSESYWLQNHFAFLILMLATFGTGRAFLEHRFQGFFGASPTAAAVSGRPAR